MARTRLSSLSGLMIQPRYELHQGRCRLAFYTVDPDPKKERLVCFTGPDDLFDHEGMYFDVDLELIKVNP